MHSLDIIVVSDRIALRTIKIGMKSALACNVVRALNFRHVYIFCV